MRKFFFVFITIVLVSCQVSSSQASIAGRGVYIIDDANIPDANIPDNSTGGTNNLTIFDGGGTAPTTSAEVPFGYLGNLSLQMDGANDYLQPSPIGDLAGLGGDPGGESFTFLSWVYTTSAMKEQILLKAPRQGGTYAQVRLRNGKLEAGYTGAGGHEINGTTVINPNRWYHVAAVFAEHESIRIYLDGVEANSIESDWGGFEGTNYTSMILGAESGSSGTLLGFIDEISLVDGAMSDNDIAYEATHSVTGSVSPTIEVEGHAVYIFDDKSRTNVPDNSTTGGHELTINGSATNSTDVPFGYIGNISLDTGAGVTLTGLSNMYGDITFQAWIKPDSVSGEQTLLNASVGAKSLVIRLNDTQLDCYYTNAGAQTTSLTGVISADVWQHVAVVLDEGNPIDLYVNGSKLTSFAYINGTYSIPVNATGTQEILGGYAYSGLIDEIRIVSGDGIGGRTPEEIEYDYNNSLFPPPADCDEAVEQGYSFPGDVSGPSGVPDCYVDLFDFVAVAFNWLNCVDPEDPTCDHIWEVD